MSTKSLREVAAEARLLKTMKKELSYSFIKLLDAEILNIRDRELVSIVIEKLEEEVPYANNTK